MDKTKSARHQGWLTAGPDNPVQRNRWVDVMGKMREEFEAWASADGYELNKSDDERFTYDYHETECAWCGWQAARKELCVSLPKQWFDEEMDCDLMEAHQVGNALDAAGVRYK